MMTQTSCHLLGRRALSSPASAVLSQMLMVRSMCVSRHTMHLPARTPSRACLRARRVRADLRQRPGTQLAVVLAACPTA